MIFKSIWTVTGDSLGGAILSYLSGTQTPITISFPFCFVQSSKAEVEALWSKQNKITRMKSMFFNM